MDGFSLPSCYFREGEGFEPSTSSRSQAKVPDSIINPKLYIGSNQEQLATKLSVAAVSTANNYFIDTTYVIILY